ncbi:AAA family ATPase [Enterocloster aldenensis]|uniref:AAA family ATPase n=1 Tax=Enterocloster aldenensis TaxID=358742 RepID=UPI00140DD9D5
MLERFLVKKLFGLFDNEIVFNKDGSTILVGPNGCGKTTMLNMIKYIFVKNHYRLLKCKFR